MDLKGGEWIDFLVFIIALMPSELLKKWTDFFQIIATMRAKMLALHHIITPHLKKGCKYQSPPTTDIPTYSTWYCAYIHIFARTVQILNSYYIDTQYNDIRSICSK